MGSNARMEGKLLDVVAKGWHRAMPVPDQVLQAITEGVRLALMEHLSGKQPPALPDPDMPQFLRDAMARGEQVTKLVPPPAPPHAPQNAAPVPPAPPPAPTTAQPPKAAPQRHAYTVANVSVSDNIQRYLNVKLEDGPQLRFHLNSATQYTEWMSVLVRLVLATGVVPDENGGWDTDELVGRKVELAEPATGTVSGLLQMQDLVP